MYSKSYYLKSKLRGFAILLLSVIMALSLFFASACSDDEKKESTDSSSDSQTILNGNFEFYTDSDDKTHIIYTPNNWSSSVSGNSNYVANGVLDTSDSGWAKLEDPELATTLDDNEDLLDDDDDDNDDDYVDYNMESKDIPYKNTYAGVKGEDLDGNTYYTLYGDDESGYYIIDDNGDEVSVTYDKTNGYYIDDNLNHVYVKELIDNPGTHNEIITDKTKVPSDVACDAYYVADISDPRYDDKDCAFTNTDGDTCIKLFLDESTGDYYYNLDYDDDGSISDTSTRFESHVLMIHNFVNADTRYGTAQSYSSSTTVTLQPNTAAELTVWVKTAELIYDRNGSEIDEGRGAYIEVEQTVSGTSVDSLFIENIRVDDWTKYTIYIRGCDFGESTVTVTLGLGQSDTDYGETCEGYAFFDDVQCTVYTDISETTYSSLDTTAQGNIEANTTCYLTSEEDEKIFNTDEVAQNSGYYYLDLSSRKEHKSVALTGNTSVDYLRDSDYYVTSDVKSLTGYNITNADTGSKYSSGTYKVNYLDDTIDTSYDVLGVFDLSKLTTELASTAYTSTGLGYSYYSDTVKTVLSSYYGEDYVFDDNETYSDALMILSAYGASYTATVTNEANFTVKEYGYKIVSFWLKTSDMKNLTAATITLNAYKYDDEGNLLNANDEIVTDFSSAVLDSNLSASVSADTTGVTYEVGDNDDIYNGWVQCFFYIENTTSYPITFEMDISFGNTTIKDTDASNYRGGYLAIADIQTIDIDEEIYDLVSTGNYASVLSLTTSDARTSSYFDTTVTVDTNNIETAITDPSSYTGVNGGSASVAYSSIIDTSGYDQKNGNDNAGLINQDYWSAYLDGYLNDSNSYKWVEVLLNYIIDGGYTQQTAYDEALTAISGIFGSTSIQPLLIVNTVQTFATSDRDVTYSMNYGYLANSSTSVSSDSYEIITVRVYVSKGAVAYVYLTENDGTSSDVMTLNLPEISLWYDNQGNVLKSAPDYDDDNYKDSENIKYYIRDDGLYEDENGNLFANLNNYSRLYYNLYYDEDSGVWKSYSYYYVDENGAVSKVLYENIDNDEVYYISEAEALKAANGDDSAIQCPHYLVAYASDVSYTRVFIYDENKFSDESSDDYGPDDYHYIIVTPAEDEDDDDTVSYSAGVSNFEITEEMIRYDNTDTSTSEMYAVIDARYTSSGELATSIADAGYDANGNYVADTWQTVSFYIHTGDTSYDYTLELWSGARETTGVDVNGNVIASEAVDEAASMEGSFVAFDLSNETTDEDTYASLLEQYTDEIIDAYVRLLYATGNLQTTDAGGNTIGVIEDNEQNVKYFKDLYDGLVDDGAIDESEFKSDSELYGYWKLINNLNSVLYYTYSLYDDAGYVPFNAEVAEDDETGYDYSLDDYEETLVFLSYVSGYTTPVKQSDGSTINVYTGNYVTFIDYSASDVTVDSNIASDSDDEDEDDDSEFSVWLLVASIILVVVLIFTMISLLVRDIVKRVRRKRVNVKNVYTSKRKHYIRKLGLTEAEETDEESSEGSPSDDKTE
ncbi:MAG: hypothetical protein LUD27_04380 [Clostridia bacterium]|nr:hypothetical protein [Clostridia bacterium]